MTEAETDALFERAAEYMAERIEQAAIVELPSPYIFVEQMWPPALAAEILRNMYASEPSFSEQVHKGDPKNFFGSYRERIELHLPAGASKLEPRLADFWKRLHAVTESDVLFAAIFNKFRSGFDDRYGSDWSAAEIHGMLRRGLLLTMHGPGYYLGPHTDRFEKVITCVFNFAEHDGLDDIGTAMYLPKQKGFTSDGDAHHDPALFVLNSEMEHLFQTVRLIQPERPIDGGDRSLGLLRNGCLLRLFGQLSAICRGFPMAAPPKAPAQHQQKQQQTEQDPPEGVLEQTLRDTAN